LKKILRPVIKGFQPHFIIISNGLDAGQNDPLGGYNITPETGYPGLLRRLFSFIQQDIVDSHLNLSINPTFPKVMLMLEGLLFRNFVSLQTQC